MSARTVISLSGVTRSFGPVRAVDGLSLDLAEGEFFALLGPSGCGKTTLLRMIAGFEHPDAGEILLDGKDLTGIRANRRPVNLMFQSYALFPHMSVRANISYGLEMESLSRREIRDRVDEILERTELSEFASRRPDQLSGGQRQRVALARALIKRPRVLLLDEPLGALDKKLREQMQLELKRLQHDLGITFVVVTHDQEEALVLADRIALMRDGRIAQLGAPAELYETPNSRFVADFIGLTNFLEGETVDGGIRVGAHGVFPASGEFGAGQAATLAVRPERVRLSPARDEAAECALEGRIADIAYHGQDLSVHVTVDGLDRTFLVKLPAAESDAVAFENGQSVWCTWNSRHGRILTQ